MELQKITAISKKCAKVIKQKALTSCHLSGLFDFQKNQHLQAAERPDNNNADNYVCEMVHIKMIGAKVRGQRN